jgi:hypothetical protein
MTSISLGASQLEAVGSGVDRRIARVLRSDVLLDLGEYLISTHRRRYPIADYDDAVVCQVAVSSKILVRGEQERPEQTFPCGSLLSPGHASGAGHQHDGQRDATCGSHK